MEEIEEIRKRIVDNQPEDMDQEQVGFQFTYLFDTNRDLTELKK